MGKGVEVGLLLHVQNEVFIPEQSVSSPVNLLVGAVVKRGHSLPVSGACKVQELLADLRFAVFSQWKTPPSVPVSFFRFRACSASRRSKISLSCQAACSSGSR